MTIKNQKAAVNEDFLSDIAQKPATAENIAGAPEATTPSDDDDFADLLGGTGSAQQNSQSSQEASAIENLNQTLSGLKDLINNQAVALQKLTDKVENMGQQPAAEPAPAEPAPAEPAPAEPAPAEPAEPAPEGGDQSAQNAPPNLDLDLDNAADAGQDEQPPAQGGDQQQQQPAQAAEPNTEDKPNESQDDDDDTSRLDESAEGDELKSENYRANKKFGKMLNSTSGSIIGIVESGKLYKLDPILETAIFSKIRHKIDEAKIALKKELLGEEYKPAEAPAVNEEQKVDEKLSFMKLYKDAKVETGVKGRCKSGSCEDDKKTVKDEKKSDESKKSDDKKNTEEKKDEE